MQRTLIATIALALALTCVMGAGYTPSSYVKAPVSVAQNNETNFTNTNATNTLGLASITTGEVYLYAANATINTNVSNYGWSVVAKKLEAKALTAAASPLIYNFNLTNTMIFTNSYAIGLISETESDITNLKIYQVPLTTTGGAGAALPKLTYTNNTNGTAGAFVPSYLTHVVIGKVVYIFYLSADKTVTITSFTVGGTLSTTSIVLTTGYTGGLQVTWGESLGTSKVFAMWNEGVTTLKDAAVDLTAKTNVTANTVDGYVNSTFHTCYAYATDKTLYGEICTSTNKTDTEPKNHTITYAVRTTNNGSKLANFTTYNLSGPSYVANYAYGPYLIFDLINAADNTANYRYYEIWNFDNSSLCRQRTLYLQINNTASVAKNFRVVSGGLYTLFYDKAADKDSTLTGLQVGLLLGSSNLASVLGFLLTIIAGLLLF